MGSERDIPGTLFRGADGNLYFVPNEALEPFLIFDSVRDRVEALFNAGSEIEAIYTTLTIYEPSDESDTSLKSANRYLGETGQ